MSEEKVLCNKRGFLGVFSGKVILVMIFWVCLVIVVECVHHKGSCTYYVITDRGGGSLQMITVLHRGASSQMITILHRGGPPKWLQYYMGVVWQMIIVYHESWVVTLGILFPKTWQKNILFSVGKKSFLGGMSKWLQLYIGGVRPNDYSIT